MSIDETSSAKTRRCPSCSETLNIAELPDYLLRDEGKKIKCFNCKNVSHLSSPARRGFIGAVLFSTPLFFLASIPSLIAIALLIDYLGGNWSGRQVGIVFLFPACLAVTYLLSRYIMRLTRFYFCPLELL